MAASIREVLAHYGADDLPEAIGWRSMKCCFHSDRHASARYCSNGDVEAFKCMACPAQGDAISLVKQQEGLEYKEALAFLEQITGEDMGAATANQPRRYKPVRLGDSSPGAPAPRPKATRRKRRRVL